MLTISRKENIKFPWPLLDNFFFFSSLTLPSECYLEKEMATHFNILAWKIPWMEEPGRL